MVDLFTRQLLQSLSSEPLHDKGSHHTAVEHRVAKRFGGQFFLRGEISEEAAGKAVACAGWIDDLFERQRGNVECTLCNALGAIWCLGREERSGAVLAVLDDEDFRAHLEDLAGGE